MALFTWKPEYSVHNAVLDRHHQHLFGVLNSVYESVMTSEKLDSILPKINELCEYTSYHFSAEEACLKMWGFTGADSHMAKHRQFTRSIKALQARYNNNDLEVARELIIMLGEWLLQHVLKEDMKYAEFADRSSLTH